MRNPVKINGQWFENPVEELKMNDKKYIVYDERATYDEDEATVLTCADTLKEAKRDAREMGYPCVVFEYDFDGKTATNGRMVFKVDC